jgi:hypothetical protein
MPDDWLFETAHVKLAGWMAPFGSMFTAPTWQRVLVLLIGAVLSPGRRTVAAALRVTGLDQDPRFTNYHRVLNRCRWSSRRVARCLFGLLVKTFVPSGPVILGLDDTLERRWGAKIAARGIYRDPTRSSHGHFVKASGLRWLSVMLLPEIPWARRVRPREPLGGHAADPLAAAYVHLAAADAVAGSAENFDLGHGSSPRQAPEASPPVFNASRRSPAVLSR